MKTYDVVVIGAGNGGLAAAIRLLQGGARVLVVEKHNLPGGFATSFRRGRFEFEASLHELNDFGTADNAGDLRLLFDELGITEKNRMDSDSGCVPGYFPGGTSGCSTSFWCRSLYR